MGRFAGIERSARLGFDLARQFPSIETINQATQLYVLAAHVYGPRGQKIPKRGKVVPQTYNALLDKWERRERDVDIDYLGFKIPDAFVVGYGLDFAERYRNLPYIAVLKNPELE